MDRYLAPPELTKQWIIRRIIWRKQALAQGDLSERAKQWAAEILIDSPSGTNA